LLIVEVEPVPRKINKVVGMGEALLLLFCYWHYNSLDVNEASSVNQLETEMQLASITKPIIAARRRSGNVIQPTDIDTISTWWMYFHENSVFRGFEINTKNVEQAI